MIEHGSGNLLEADVEALVNSVNTVGVMGKGVALQFKQAFPDNFAEYERACRKDEVVPGKMFVHATNQLTNPKYIINFPTKRHWRGKSKIQDIEAGLLDLSRVIKELAIKSMALPPLGCGNGGLSWANVLPLIENALRPLDKVRIIVYAPEGAPSSERMPVRTKKPKMTPTRAALLALLRTYAEPGYQVTMLELQKLAYFLQMAGERMKLRFERGSYGPYTEALHHVLQRIEGHYIRGYGDRSRDVSIRLLERAEAVADDVLATHVATATHLARVSTLIEGFETPYGLELLSSVHFVAGEDPSAARDPAVATEQIHAWSDRKRDRFTAEHIALAWNRLHEQDWLQRP